MSPWKTFLRNFNNENEEGCMQKSMSFIDVSVPRLGSSSKGGCTLLPCFLCRGNPSMAGSAAVKHFLSYSVSFSYECFICFCSQEHALVHLSLQCCSSLTLCALYGRELISGYLRTRYVFRTFNSTNPSSIFSCFLTELKANPKYFVAVVNHTRPNLTYFFQNKNRLFSLFCQ